jgi:hypothetical protein
MIEIVQALQVLFVAAWSLPLVLFRKFAWCHPRDAFDRLRTAVWYVALSTTAFPLRWLVFPSPLRHMPHDELAVWAGLYVLAILAAFALTARTQEVCRGRTRR